MTSGIGFKVGPKYLLDLYPTAAMAFSLRRLRQGYTGNCIKVRRSSDNTTSNIGFTANGELDESALTTFVGSNNGFVATWYDQSGNGRDATQATNAYQPKIVDSGTVVRIGASGTKPVIRGFITNNYCSLDTTYSNLQALPVTIIAVAKVHTLATNAYSNVSMFIAGTAIGAGDSARYSMNCNTSKFDYFRRNTSNGISMLTANYDTNWHIHQAFWRSTGTEVRARTDTTDYGPNSLTGTEYNTASNWTLFGPPGATQFVGDFSIAEAIFYVSDKYDNRADFGSRIKTYWGI